MSVPVNIDNFREAETARMMDSFVLMAGGVNTWGHLRAPTPVESQPVIRMNVDTLYSFAVVDISEGATLTIPEAGGRYLSVMAVNDEHYINHIYRDPGVHQLTMAEHGTAFLTLVARFFVDPTDPADVAAVNALQEQLGVEAAAARPYHHAAYDTATLDATRQALLTLGAGLPDAEHTFGRKGEVDPTRHLIGTALGWGGLPEHEAYYYIESRPRDAGHFTFTLSDVPVDAFWSVTIYNRDGYLEANPYHSYSLNSVTAKSEPDGTVVLHLAPQPGGHTNHLYVMDGWNYALRLYRPRPEVLDKSWTPPTPQPAD